MSPGFFRQVSYTVPIFPLNKELCISFIGSLPLDTIEKVSNIERRPVLGGNSVVGLITGIPPCLNRFEIG